MRTVLFSKIARSLIFLNSILLWQNLILYHHSLMTSSLLSLLTSRNLEQSPSPISVTLCGRKVCNSSWSSSTLSSTRSNFVSLLMRTLLSLKQSFSRKLLTNFTSIQCSTYKFWMERLTLGVTTMSHFGSRLLSFRYLTYSETNTRQPARLICLRRILIVALLLMRIPSPAFLTQPRTKSLSLSVTRPFSVTTSVTLATRSCLSLTSSSSHCQSIPEPKGSWIDF